MNLCLSRKEVLNCRVLICKLTIEKNTLLGNKAKERLKNKFIEINTVNLLSDLNNVN